ncbi:GNAT family N-acetyltransferase [Macrococcus hajekii]|uniref:GNAT family N-acetyltransferase n=1 Tax=Macrococcus hajekii TaxID=198482 RepID=A0A4R6BIU9_9STAP|nr:GNAT family N-acetyltransferase [Macrococcus hajekii]TDM01585.1 GNAT family N-acetyltransferase [Macrococcus hajekii]GGB01230.1 acetyltransferase [Macrococcus hajekii]
MWHIQRFEELTTKQWFDIVKLRIDTFIVEQRCAYPEVDDEDLSAIHIFKGTDEIEAYARIIEREDLFIGRVIVNPKYRGKGLARELMKTCMEYINEHYPARAVKLQGQAHLADFYRSFGFEVRSVIYFEDMIPHVDMELTRV